MKLKIKRKVGQVWTDWAKGSGEPSSTVPFSIEIEDKYVDKGQTYLITQLNGSTIGTASCTTGAEKGKTAQFGPYQAQDEFLHEVDHRSLATIQQLQSLLMAAQKTVLISIDSKDLVGLKDAGYRLCFAKKVAEGEFNVVWQSYSAYLASNEFSWIPMYQLFGSNTFKSNVTVKVQTNIVDIGLGETSILDKYGVLSAPKTGGPETSISLINDYDSIHPGVNQLSTGIDGTQVSTPIYVAAKPIVQGTAKLTPVERVLVWFEQNIETSTMFSDARSRSVEIDLTTTNQATRLYQGGAWSTP